MKLICHIGTPHAAAELIQDSFAANSDWLAQRGIAYGEVLAKGAAHETLALVASDRPSLKGLAQAYGITSADELAQFRDRVGARIGEHVSNLPSSIRTVVMSSENLTGQLRHVEETRALKTFLSKYFDEIEIVVYLRRQDDAILAAYQESIRLGTTADLFQDFVQTCLGNTSQTPHLFYRHDLKKWVETWGQDNVIVRRYSVTDFIGGDVVSDFMGVVQQTWEPDLKGFSPASVETQGLSAPALEFLRRLQDDPRFLKDGSPSTRRAKLTATLRELPAQPRPIMPVQTSRQIMTRFRGANVWLKETFYPDLDDAFFPDRPDHPEHGNIGELSAEESVAFTRHILANVEIKNP